MSIKTWKCPKCGVEFKTKVEVPEHCEGVKAELIITSPGTKFMEKMDPERGKSKMVDQEKILKERARAYSRDNELSDLIEKNDKQLAYMSKWLKSDGTKRKKIDDL